MGDVAVVRTVFLYGIYVICCMELSLHKEWLVRLRIFSSSITSGHWLDSLNIKNSNCSILVLC